MRLVARNPAHAQQLREAFCKREIFTLTGAGLTAQYIADQMETVFDPGPSFSVTFQQVALPADATEWNGEGLPPVGAEFEGRFADYDDGRSSWAWGRVLAHGQRRIFYVDRTGDEWSHAPADMEFRPIRTPEQIAADEREKAIEEMRRDTTVTGVARAIQYDQAERLYELGYRKQVQP